MKPVAGKRPVKTGARTAAKAGSTAGSKAAPKIDTKAATRSAPAPGRPKVRPSALVAADTAGDAETRIYQSVLGGVMGQRLLPGTKLPEAALCELFGVGRSVVQKALQRLAHDHVVELRPNRGAIVAMPTREEVVKLFEARRVLEGAILPLVARSATKADFAMLRRQLREEHHAMHSAPQTEWARLASTFHLKLGELSGNPLLARYLMEIISRCALVVAIFQPPGNAACEHDEHARVVDYLEQGKVTEAVAEMDAHLRDLESHIQLVEEPAGRSLADMLGLG